MTLLVIPDVTDLEDLCLHKRYVRVCTPIPSTKHQPKIFLQTNSEICEVEEILLWA